MLLWPPGALASGHFQAVNPVALRRRDAESRKPPCQRQQRISPERGGVTGSMDGRAAFDGSKKRAPRGARLTQTTKLNLLCRHRMPTGTGLPVVATGVSDPLTNGTTTTEDGKPFNGKIHSQL